MGRLRIAYFTWVRSRMLFGKCCYGAHFTKPENDKVDPLPDNSVCERERNWRAYVRIRDGNPVWMPAAYPDTEKNKANYRLSVKSSYLRM